MSGILIFDFPNDLYWLLKVVGHLHSMNNCRSAWLYPSHPVPGCFSQCSENCLIQLQSSSLSESSPFKPIKLFILVSKSSNPHGALKKPSAFWTQTFPRSDFIFHVWMSLLANKASWTTLALLDPALPQHSHQCCLLLFICRNNCAGRCLQMAGAL